MDPKLIELLERGVMALEAIDQSLVLVAKAAELIATDPVYIPTGTTLIDVESAAATRLKLQAAMDGRFPRPPQKIAGNSSSQ